MPGITFNIQKKCIKSLLNAGLEDVLVSDLKDSEDKKLAKVLTSKGKKISGIPKLDDANKAGTNESHKCTLILTEGDSAKALAIAGLEVIGRNYYGVYPLKGKLLNVREASLKKLEENKEI